MSIKASAWHVHQSLGKVKVYGSVSNGVATVMQVYKDGVSMLFFERGDRNMPCGFSREEVKLFELLLLNTTKKTALKQAA